MLEASGLTGSLRDAAELAGCSHHTVGRYVRARDAGGVSDRAAARPQLADEFCPRPGEWMERPEGRVAGIAVRSPQMAAFPALRGDGSYLRAG